MGTIIAKKRVKQRAAKSIRYKLETMTHVVLCKTPYQRWFEPIAAFNCKGAADVCANNCAEAKARMRGWEYKVEPVNTKM